MLRIAIVAEKPSFAAPFAEALRAVHPDLDARSATRIFASPFSTLDTTFDLRLDDPDPRQGFRYPRGLRWNEFPVILEPSYKPLSPHGGGETHVPPARIGLGPGPFVRLTLDDDVSRLFRDADVVYGFMDASSGSVHAFDRMIRRLFPEGVDGRRILYPWMSDLTRKAVEDAVRNAEDWHAVRDRHLGHSLVKRRFTYNYALNGFAVLGRALASAAASLGVDVPMLNEIVASRHSLQILYVLRGSTAPVTTGEFLQAMHLWKGTGRHVIADAHDVFGSSASRLTMIDRLIRAGLVDVERTDPGRPKAEFLSLSPLGAAWLDRLHPDCRDPDQGFRLETWRRMPVEAAYPKVDRYIRTFFGKQKRFLARCGR